jgi:predicted DNA-binding protein (UPF0251 family)/predicted Fe-Mo cluster-binding NifX family protein
MPCRRRRTRCIAFQPGVRCFKPCGQRSRGLDTVVLRGDELEALRLADLEGLYQEPCAARMGISRTTLSRTLAAAHRKVANALVNGKRVLVEPSPEAISRAEGRGISQADTSSTEHREHSMKKIVLTANDGRGLDGEMSLHFGHCTHFVVAHVDIEQRVATTEVHPNPYAERHEPGQIPNYIKSLGADVVVAGGMGGKAIEWFRQLGIEVATGVRASVAETLNAYLAGDLAGVAECGHEQPAL